MADTNFVDYVKIHCKSGKGGAGSAHLRREKFVPKGGPDGGDGGRGGHIILEGSRNKWTLLHLKYKKHIKAGSGEAGGAQKKSGANGEDAIIEVPLGTIARDAETGEYLFEITEDGQQKVLLKGGRGGLGNDHFKSSTFQTPRFAQPGEDGEEGWKILELKVLADVGLVGFPSSGKSTLLSVVSAAKPKIAEYHFTTLTPNLGIVGHREEKSFVMADIPGIIEGAHEGKGLGLRFLRHIERTDLFLHLVDLSGMQEGDPLENFAAINRELEQYNPELMARPMLVVFTKLDMTEVRQQVADLEPVFASQGVRTLAVSAVTGEGIPVLVQTVSKELGRIRTPRRGSLDTSDDDR